MDVAAIWQWRGRVCRLVGANSIGPGRADRTGRNTKRKFTVKENTVDTGETGNGDFVDPAEFIGYIF